MWGLRIASLSRDFIQGIHIQGLRPGISSREITFRVCAQGFRFRISRRGNLGNSRRGVSVGLTGHNFQDSRDIQPEEDRWRTPHPHLRLDSELEEHNQFPHCISRHENYSPTDIASE